MRRDFWGPTMVYLIEKPGRRAVKVGIGVSDGDRLRDHLSQGWRIVDVWPGLSTEDARAAEALVLERWEAAGAASFLSPDEMPQAGWTETADARLVDLDQTRERIVWALKHPDRARRQAKALRRQRRQEERRRQRREEEERRRAEELKVKRAERDLERQLAMRAGPAGHCPRCGAEYRRRPNGDRICNECVSQSRAINRSKVNEVAARLLITRTRVGRLFGQGRHDLQGVLDRLDAGESPEAIVNDRVRERELLGLPAVA